MATTTPTPSTSRGRAAVLLLVLLAAVGGAVVLTWGARADERAAPAQVDLRYLAVNGDGPNARGWYDGAPPTGVPVQEALTTFAKEGFRVVEISQSFLITPSDPARWTILLERTR